MRIGDLVMYDGKPREAQGRARGIILMFDVYKGSPNYPEKTEIIQVLWEKGRGWITRDRVKVLDESR